MDSRLTDAQLIQLVQEKLPEELTHAEIRQLHERLRESTQLRAVLIEQLHLEAYLSAALGEINLSVDEIVRRADKLKKSKPANRWPFWTGLAGLMLLIGIGIYFATRPDPVPQQLAGEPENEKTVAESEDAEPKPADPIGDPKEPEDQTPPVVPKETGTIPPENEVADVEPDPMPQGRPDDPWFEALDPDAAPLALAETAYRMPAFTYAEPLQKSEAARWLEPAPGKPFKIEDRESDRSRWVELNGVGRLKAPWVPGTVLRLSLFEEENFRLHFWCGEEGVTLTHYRHRHPRLWAAYRSQRKNNQPTPEAFTALLTTDDGRQSRVRSGTLELRVQDGSLLMTQGRVLLLRVPLAGCPEEVIFDGRVMLSELVMYRGEPFPLPAEPPRPEVLTSNRPAELTWLTTLPGRDMREGIRELGQARETLDQWQETLAEGVTVSTENGAVALSAEKTDENVYVATKLPQPGLQEVIFRVDEATPGTAVYFGDERGKELHRVAFFRDRQTGQTVFDSSRAHESHTDVDKKPERTPAPYFARGHWIRVVWGFGCFKIYTSGDGQHWGMFDNPTPNLPGPFSTIGLVVRKTETPARIQLAHLEVRELTAITSLASLEARQQVPSFGNLADLDFGTWNQKVIGSWPVSKDAPPAFSMDEWRRASVIRSLSESPWSPLSGTLLRGLLEDGLKSSRPIEERFRLLDEVSLLYDLRDGRAASAMVRMYERLGNLAAEVNLVDPFGETVHRLLTAPIWTDSNMSALSPDFPREMAIYHTFSRDWKSLRSVARRTEFLMLDSHPRKIWWWEKDERAVLEWAEAIANLHLPEERDEGENWTRQIARGRQWRHPLVTQVSKEGYNVIAEFEAALASDSYEDACRIITSAGRSGMAGLLPDSKDPDLLVSLPRAIAIAMKEHPELQTTMREQFGEVGRVRVREAMTRADVPAIEAATVRFYGTPAAAEAFRWLGDRALASGRFAQAAQAYQEALPFADSGLAKDIANRLRLAAGLLGHEVKHEETGSVQIAEASWSEAEFEKLIEELRNTHARAESSTLADWNPALDSSEPLPEPARIQANVRNRLEGDLGKSVGKYEDRNTDWVARQISVATLGDLMFVSNRFQVAAYQTADGKARWSRGLGDEQGDVHQWPMIPMRPLVLGDRIFVRRLTKRGPELCCLAKSDGKVLWHVRPEHHVASDPVYVQNRLLAIVATMPQSGILQLELASFHPENGDVLSQQPLLHLQDEWSGRPPCQILATGGRILLTIGGTTLSADPSGQPQWLQKHPWFPPSVDRYSKLQYHQPPIVLDGRVFVTQAGVKEIASFNLDTGRKFWSLPVPDIRRLVGIAGGALIVETDLGFEAFDQSTGDVLWQHHAPDVFDGILATGDRLIYSRNLEYSSDGNLCLVWLDAKTGAEISHAVVNSLEGENLRFGPLVRAGDKLWGFFGRGFKEAARDLVELTPEKTLPPAGPLFPDPLATWPDDVRPNSFANTALVLPGWVITTSQDFSGKEKGVQLVDDFRGETFVAKTLIRDRRPVHFARKIEVPKDKTSKLKLRVGHDPGKNWTLEVSLGNDPLLEQAIDDETAPNGWLDREVDLSPWAGQTVWLSVSQTTSDEEKDPGVAYWKSLEIRSE